MENRLARLRRLLALGACLFLCSCGLVSESAVKLITNHPEMAAYAERFNARQQDVRVELEFRETPYQSVQDGEQADAVMGEWLATPQIMDKFDSVSDVVKPGRIEPSWFYSRLLDMGSKDNRPVLIPVSFNLPAIVFFNPGGTTDLPSMFIPLELMRSMSQSFSGTGKGPNSSMGFSPLWNTDFLSWTAALYGARLRAGRGGVPTWDSEGLKNTVGFLRIWVAQVNGGKAQDKAFFDRNFVQPYYKLLSARKILFALTPFSDFFALPEDERRDFDYRWPSSGGVIPVQDDVLFAGVLRSARNKKGAKTFLEWFFSPQNQKSLLETAQSRRIAVFGMTDGFSSFKTINEKDLAQKYPLLLGHIPTENLLQFPDTLPDNWVKMRDEVVQPFLAQAAAGDDSPTLTEMLEKWQETNQKK
jgi:ABC-type glycerol-3-phosphate transport system substrate-binding protein